MTFTLFFSLAFAHLVAVISPGPDFFYIVKSAFQRGLLIVFFQQLELGLVYFCSACLHSGVICSLQYHSKSLLDYRPWCVYLVYIGFMGLISKSTDISNENQPIEHLFQP